MKTRQVDYYLIPGTAQGEQLQFACRLVEKAWHQSLGVLVLCPDYKTAETFDERLWNWREDSFIPHVFSPETVPVEPVIVSSLSTIKPLHENNLLINLDHQIPEGFESFSRLAEIVFDNEDCKTSSRDKFRYYREQGLKPRIHDLKSRRTG